MEKKFFIIFSIVIASYIIGSIPFGFLIGKIKGIDIRKHGSGNIGATNVLRIFGKKYGYICFILDFLKGFIPVIIAGAIAKKTQNINPDFIKCAAFAGTFSGHVWTIFLNFKGGKGVATAAGAIFAISPISVICSLIIWFAVFSLSRFVSLASIVASAFLPVFYGIYTKLLADNFSSIIFISFFLVSLLSIIKHHSNIKRLLNGTEIRFDRRKNEN
ncbi:MAG TPA: glycerol-3-phosphate 1-O-acyltransferase PlsY [Victivallales bacterium]|nr:glycerol-3-phosphate 1-O-acyltransferase PlsY [Victivallales bacterium]HRR06090.1 glycerol-3-phosphate 1-O-acyltransferase PlsY [Victivallales bacterium]HRR28096.1 glycerol-3-phosphate 1-O-acyltransferase PlsY [Victivallales bacterium]